MRVAVLLFLLISSTSVFSQENTLDEDVTALQVHRVFLQESTVTSAGLIDIVDKEEKVGSCAEEYVKKQSKTYAKIVKENLYDLIHNFDDIASRIYGKKNQNKNDVPYIEKIEALAHVQCNTYYQMGILR